VSLIDVIAAHIRRVDGGNRLTPHELGMALCDLLGHRPYRLDSTELIGFVKRTNPDKRMGAGALAELIVAEFNLDEEQE
jgi:hypothetical protein